MKFGKEFKRRKVPEWTDAYVDYNGLKGILREILLHKLSNQPPTPLRALQQKLKLHRSFSGLHARPRSPAGRGDIEDQVIDVKRLSRDGSGHFYKTDFLKRSEDGGEFEAGFFRKLDEELNKVNTFYKNKVEAIMSEAAKLNKQVDALIALRIKVERKNPSRDKVTDMSLRSDTPSTARTQGTVDMVEPEVEMSGRTRLEESLDSWSDDAACDTSDLTLGVDMSDNYQLEESSDPEDDSVRTTNCSSYDREEENINGGKEDSLEILEHVEFNNTLESPVSTIKGVFKDSKDDELRFRKEELKNVNERLKHVFIEFYQKLLLLKHYSSMNLAAFSKIMKKYEKITSRRASRSYIKIVDNSYLGRSDEVNGLLERVEATFINHFSNSNRREGMKLLRPKAKREKQSVTFLSGFFSGCFIALLVAVTLSIEARKLMDRKVGAFYMVNIFPLYSLFGYVVLHMLMYAADICFWRRYQVNYPFIFGFNQGTELGYREVFLLSTGLAVLALTSFLANLHLDMGSRTQHYKKLTQLIPLFSITIVIIILFCPFDIIYRSSRFFFIKTVFHCVCAPLYKVTLPDFFLADNLTSQIQAIRSIDLYICYYGLGEHSRRQDKCHNNGIYNTLYSVVAIIPFWLRFLQCLRRLCEEKDAIHGYNGLKFFLIIVAVLIRTAFELKKGTTWLVLALVSSAFAIAMSTYWDIVMDWGLLRRKSKNPYLRDKLVISHKSVYYMAMVLNILLRIAWMQLVLAFNLHSLHKMTITTVISCLEIIRRGIWNFFRLENEHLNNVGKFRAFKSVPLPFRYYENDKETDKDD